jgi:hypothetical protein
MTDAVTPALTPEQWAAGSTDASDDPVVQYSVTLRTGGFIEVANLLHGVRIPEDLRHAAAALALHAQPFGFTWADVDLLQNAIDLLYQEFGGNPGWRPDGDKLRPYTDLANRIAALLPPRAP